MRPLAPPPYERPNWNSLNYGQKLYAMRQYNKARTNRQLPVDTYNVERGSSTNRRGSRSTAITAYLAPNRQPSPSDYFADIETNSPPSEELLDSIEQQLAAEEEPLLTDSQAINDFDLGQLVTQEEEERDQAFNDEFNEILATMTLPGTAGEVNGPPPKKAKTGKGPADSTSTSSSSAESIDTNGGNSAGISGASADGGYMVPRPVLSQNIFIRRFNKVHKIMSYGVAPTIITKTVTALGKNFYLTTSLLALPVEDPRFYLTYGEWQSLKAGARAVELKVKVYQRNIRVAFETNTTTSQLATLNQNKNCVVSIGLNKHPWYRVSGYTFAADNTMIPNDIEQAANVTPPLEQMMYGTNSTGIAVANAVPASLCGTPFALNRYVNIGTYVANPIATVPPFGYPNITPHLHQFDGADFVGKEICSYTYKPILGHLKRSPDYTHYGWGNTDGTSTNSVILSNPAETVKTAGMSNTGRSLTDTNIFIKDKSFTYTDIIEKKQFGFHIGNTDSYAKIQPSLSVGVMAVPNMDTGSNAQGTAEKYTDVQALWDIETEIVVSEYDRYEFPAKDAHQWEEQDYPVFISSALGEGDKMGQATRQGLYISNSNI